MRSKQKTAREKAIALFDFSGYILERTAAFFCIIAVGLMVTVVSSGVFFRYVLMRPLGWAEEVSRYLMIWATCLAIGIGIYRRSHIGITFVLDKLSGSLKKGVMLVSDLLVFVFLLFFTYKGYFMAINGQEQISPLLGIKMTWVLAAVPVGGALCLLQIGFRFLKDAMTAVSEF
jgi:TRAP-type C4-dicarboxylate transport system permease small subunit